MQFPRLSGLKVKTYEPGNLLVIARRPYINIYLWLLEILLFGAIIMLFSPIEGDLLSALLVKLAALAAIFIFVCRYVNAFGGKKVWIDTSTIRRRRFVYPLIKKEEIYRRDEIASLYVTTAMPKYASARSYYGGYRLVAELKNGKSIDLFHIKETFAMKSSAKKLSSLLF